jgi:hypothetical protein
MLKPTTIDNLDIKTHERYAQDQQIYDKSFITESTLLSPHLEIAATSTIYSSKWEELFEMGTKNIPWAAFSPPAHQRQTNRFFSYRILPTIFVAEETDEEEEEEQKKREDEILKKVIRAKKGKNQDPSLFERDRSSILNLLETVRSLNQMLSQINSRKLQYQKG